MYVIGERINGMFENVKRAIRHKDAKVIQDLAKRQLAAGAVALDVNVGPAAADAQGAMLWLAESIRAVTDAALSIDTARWEVMSAVVPKIPGEKILNSSKADPQIASQYVGLAAEHKAGLIGLTIDAAGVPGNVEKPTHCMQAIAQLKLFADPPPHLLIGLSNVSQRCRERGLINRTYLAMAMAHGLDAAIMDPLDEELMSTAITADLLGEKMIYCDSYLEAARHR